MNRRLVLTIALVLVGALTLAPAALAEHKPGHGGGGGGGGGGPQPGDGLLTVPITGTFTDALGEEGIFDGSFTVQSFRVVDGQLSVVGTLVGTLTDSLGNVVGTITRSITLPVSANATCEILALTLGPLDLDLLGLVVHLDQVVLTIDAEAGPGNLLGNLLCAVAGLLDGGLSLNIVADLLNVIVDVINDLGL
jgi:hypothetical protein